MQRSINAIVGISDNSVSSALNSLPDLHVRFATNDDAAYSLIPESDKKKVKKLSRLISTTAYEFDRQLSVRQRKTDQFQAARDGNLVGLENLFNENRSNPRIFFNRLDPETKLTALHYAARFHHLDICEYLIKNCEADVNKAGEDGMTPLHYIARFRVEKDSPADSYGNVIQYLIHHGANINACDIFQATPLHHACERNNVKCAEILISKNANIAAVDRQNMQPLHGACFYGSLDTARLLIEHGADLLATDGGGSIPVAHACRNSHYKILDMIFNTLNQHETISDIVKAADNDQNTLLHLAVASANVEIVDLLLSKHADPSAKRADGQTPIHLCAKTDSIEILEKLIQAGGDINDVDNENETILHKAATHNKENILAYVLLKQNNKEFIQKKNLSGITAVFLAVTYGHAACVKCLLEAGADMFNNRDKRERGPIHLASMRNHIQTLEILLKHARENGGVEKEKLAINEIDRYSRTALHAAAELGHVDIVSELLKREASLIIKDDDEYTPLMLCCKKNHLAVLKIFIDYINIRYQASREKLNILEERDDQSNTALHIAAAEGHSSIIKLLLEQNCDLQSRNMISCLPIHCAAERGRYNSVRTLIENHSPVDPVDKNQQTPLHLAARKGHSEVVKLLLKNGAQIDKRTSSGDNCLDLAISTNQYNVAEKLVNHRDWALILRNAQYDEHTKLWDTPLRKLIRKMPDIALIVLNRCCTITTKSKNEQLSSNNDNTNENKKNKIKKSKQEYILELEEQLNSNNIETSGLSKDETQIHNLAFVYTYEFLDDQFLHEKWQKGDTDSIFEPDGRLYPGMNNRELDSKRLNLNHPFTIMADKNRQYLLDHPVVHSLLDYKWNLYARYVYYFNFLFYLLFVASLTTYVFITFAPYSFGTTHDQMNEMTCSELCSLIRQNNTETIERLQPRIRTLHIFQWFVIILASMQIVKELFQIRTDRLEYINLENAVELSAFILAILFAVDFNACSREIGYRCVIQWELGALGVFLTWFALVLFIQKFPSFGIFVVMLTDILRTFSRFFLVFFLFVIGFALAFHMLLQNHNPFQHFGNSLLKTCVMMIGEFEYEGIFHGDNANYFGITYFFFIIFIIVMSIIIMNLLVGLAVDDINSVMRVATLKRLEMRVKLTLDVERQLPRRRFFSSIRRYRIVTYRGSYWQKFFKKILRVHIKTQFDKNFARLEQYGLIQTADNQDQKGSSATTMNLQKIDDKNKSTVVTTVGIGGVSSDWITNIHGQINTKYNEFNRHMADLKTQEEKINNILQQFPITATSRHNSHSTFAPTT
ncbi:unnamed protein product [Rotaria socialis]|uniref:Ion transport domain-containing protein n=1 Tax=Rotaria socialis TaxID=392032 RepID=A0A820LVS4_9BILA|nr:unnamed protein product [Rotaria socialis]CAF4362797.1 unnamed protein product [Rotaria socialis]